MDGDIRQDASAGVESSTILSDAPVGVPNTLLFRLKSRLPQLYLPHSVA